MIRIIEELGDTWCRATVVTSGGPARVVYDEPDPKFVPRPAGFTARVKPAEAEPLVWEGDGA